MPGLSDSERAIVCACIIQGVKAGREIKDVCAEHYVDPSTIRLWRKADPEFAQELDQAKVMRSAMRHRDRKMALLQLLIDGMLVEDACATPEVNAQPNTLTRWLRTDSWFAAEYNRLLGPTKRADGGRKFDALLSNLRNGMPRGKAAVAAGYSRWNTVNQWKRRRPDLWRRVQEAYRIGQAKAA